MTRWNISASREWMARIMALCLIGATSVRAGAEPRQANGKPPADEAAALLARSSVSTFEVLPGEWRAGEPIRFRAVVLPVPQAHGSELPPQKGNWEKIAATLAAAHGDPARGVRLQATVTGNGDVVVWQEEKALDVVALAAATRKLVPDATVWSLRDVAALVDFAIPANTLRPGTYHVLLHFVTPDGVHHDFPSGSTQQTAVSFSVVAGDTRKLLPASLQDPPGLMRHALRIACPAHDKLPLDTPDDCQARSIWSLRTFEGKVYCAYGDWARNRGPIEVWSFEPRTASTDANYPPKLTFRAGEHDWLVFLHQLVVQEESIEDFRVCQGKLVIAGIDGCKEISPPDSFLFGNVYVREAGFWRKLSTLPKAGHVYDAFFFDGRLFAQVLSPAGDLFVSDNAGISWKPLAHDADLAPTGFATLGKDLVVLAGGAGAYLYRDGRLEAHRMNLLPGSLAGSVHRPTAFRGGLVYTLWHNWGRVRERSYPLYFLSSLDGPPVVISIFKDATVKDIVADGDTLYVLTSRPAGNGFVAEIFQTRDLSHWTRLAEITLPATPSALAKLGPELFIGLANRGYDPDSYSDYRPNVYAFADKASGEIWQVTRHD